MDVLNTSRDEWVSIRRRMPSAVTLLAEKVETAEIYEDLLGIGYHLFQGYYFCKPKMFRAGALSGQRMAYARLLMALNDENVTIAQVEEQATRDQLKVLGMSEAAIDQIAASRTINSLATITASVSGTVIERKVTEGQVVQPGRDLVALLQAEDEFAPHIPQPLSPERCQAAVRFLLSRQNDDGGFGTYERRRAGGLLEGINPQMCATKR